MNKQDSVTNLLEEDLNHVITHTRGFWEGMRGQSLFITGGTGFFGCWLIESFLWANDNLGLNAKAVILTRNKAAFQKKAAHLACHSALELYEGDIRSFQYPAEKFAYIVHAATDSSQRLNDEPLLMYETITAGTQYVLEFARQCGAKSILLVSSGAVYGAQPSELLRIPEEYHGAPHLDDPRAAYAEGKRVSEFLGSFYANKFGLNAKIARCFAFVGPYLPINEHFAIGNFIRDGLRSNTITVMGDGTPYRSYLYAADLAIWLWTVLYRGKTATPYNVGSDQGIPISTVAGIVADVFGSNMEVIIKKKPDCLKPPDRYVPDIQRAKNDLGLQVFIDLPEAVRRTVAWQRRRQD